MAIDVSQIVKKDIDDKVAALDARIQRNTQDIAEHQAHIDRLTADNIKLQELRDAYAGEVVANITVKVVAPVIVEPPVIG